MRLQAMGLGKYRRGFDVAVHEAALEEPLRWRQPRLVFVNSMSDLFHSSVPGRFIEAVFAVMNRANQHTFQVLTKRPDRVRLLEGRIRWTPNIWLGVSIESDRWLGRQAMLARSGARTKFLSLEPLLGPLPGLALRGIDWVIVGGESDPAPDRYRLNGSEGSGTGACDTTCRSSSSSGEACSRSVQAACWTAEPGIRCQPSWRIDMIVAVGRASPEGW